MDLREFQLPRLLRRVWHRLRRFRVRLCHFIRQVRLVLEELRSAGMGDGVNCRVGHVAVSYVNSILVWGGYQEEEGQAIYYDTDQLMVYHGPSGLWRTQYTQNAGPPPTSGATAAVVRNKMYVLCGFCDQFGDWDENDEVSVKRAGNTHDVYALDLDTWTWRKCCPTGTLPMACDKLTCWTKGTHIYIFGGFGTSPLETPPEELYLPKYHARFISDQYGAWHRGWNNQLAVYDTVNDHWEFPKCYGTTPSPRAAMDSVLHEGRVYIFGGRLRWNRLNDLYCLDLDTMTWRTLCLERPGGSGGGGGGGGGEEEEDEDDGDGDDFPCGRSWHSLTLLPRANRAILYGGFDSYETPLGDCWGLDLTQDYNSPWKFRRLPHLEQGARLWCPGVLEETSGQIWILGGVVTNLFEAEARDHIHPDSVVKLELTPRPLLLSCLDKVSDHLDALGGLETLKNELPRTLVNRLLNKVQVAEKTLLMQVSSAGHV